jgi:hypothetical protein
MARRGQAIHVATTRRHYKGKVYETHLLRRSYREGGKVRTETVGNISHLPPELIDVVRRGLKGERFLSADGLERRASLPHGHVVAVLGTLRRLGLEALIDRRPSRQRDLVVALIAARLLTPGSKLDTSRRLGQTTLGSTLGVADATEDELYAAMDWLLARQGAIEARLAARHLAEDGLVLYDLSSTYVTGRHNPLARIGYSRDGKPGTLQIEYGLITDDAGRPVAVEVVPGNTGDPATVAATIDKVRGRFRLASVVLVGDRGMLTSARIEALRSASSATCRLRWFSAARSFSRRSRSSLRLRSSWSSAL